MEDLGTLTAATSRTGEWISDCASVTKAGNYARFYSFALGQEAEVTIDLESSQDTVLNLLEGSGTSGSVIANNDDVESGNTNSRVSRTLAAGTYTVEATTFGPATTGSFTLNIALSEGTGTPEPPPISGGCVEDLGTLTATREVGGSWASDCVSTNEPNTYARFYSFTLGQEAEVQIDLTSSEDTVLYLRGPVAGGVLFNDDVENGNTNSRIAATLSAGTYTVEASTYSAGRTGSFDLSIALSGDTTTPPPDSCVEDLGTLTETRELTGSWASGCDSQTRAGSHARYYTFTLAQEIGVTIDLALGLIGNADTYLYLRRGEARSGAILYENDDHQGSQTISQIETAEPLPAGVYTIEATTYSAGQTGLFDLSVALSGVTTTPPSDSCVEDLGTLGVTSGRISIGRHGQTWTDECASSNRDGRYAQYYTITLETPGEVTITLESDDADPYLYLLQGAGKDGTVEAENDDHEGSTSESQIKETLAAGVYTIEATTYSAGRTGRFNLTIVEPRVIGPQTAALIALYEAASGDNWLNSSNWLSNELVGEWYGVTTDEQGQVIGLSLMSNGLTGELPADLAWGTFTHLEWLNLSGNRLTGQIPVGLGDLPLLSLNLSGNRLTGQIPAGLGSPLLTSLNLSNNQLTGQIPAGLGGLLNLRHLNLSRNELNSGIPAELGGLVYLRYLNLSNNQLTGQIPGQLGSLDELRVLNLEQNQLNGEIPDQLGGLGNLRMLDLGHNRLNGEIPDQLGSLDDLKVLNLESQNPFSGSVSPGRDSTLNEDRYWLNGNIPSSLGGLTKLEELNLSDNRLSGTVPTALSSLESLLRLNLNDNLLAGSIPRSLNRLDNLTSLNLSSNELTGRIPTELGGLISLVRLDLSRNQLVGQIPEQLGHLDTLWLSGNRFEDCIPEELRGVGTQDFYQLGLQFCDEVPPEPPLEPPEPPPALTGDQVALLSFYEVTNAHSDTNWDSIVARERGKEEDSDCTFGDSSVLLDDWCGVTTNEDGRVIELILSGHGHDLRGNITPALGNLEMLTHLDLSRNKLGNADGEDNDIPLRLGELTNLEVLNLSHNRDRGKFKLGKHPGMSGEIPAELGKLTNLKQLILNDNSLNWVPADLANLTSLTYVDFSRNEFWQSIESALFTLVRSRDLNYELTIKVSGNPWFAASEEGKGWVETDGPVSLTETGQETIVERELEALLSSVQEAQNRYSRAKLGYAIITSGGLRGVSRTLGSAALDELLDKVGFSLTTTTLGVAKLYYDAAIFDNPLVQQAVKSIITGLVLYPAWTTQDVVADFRQSIFAKIGLSCRDDMGNYYSKALYPGRVACEEAGYEWID